MAFTKWDALCRRVYAASLVAYVVAHHEQGEFCQWPRLVD